MIEWSSFGNVKQSTGYDLEVLEYVFQKYCGYGTPIGKPKRLFQLYKYIHKYPMWRQLREDLGMSQFTFGEKMLPAFQYLSQNLEEIYWEDRLSPFNHGHHFPLYVTGIFCC